MRFWGAIFTFLLFLALPAFSKTGNGFNDAAALEKQARKKMAKMLSKLSKSAEMKQGQFADSAPKGGVSQLDGNPITAVTAFHSNVMATCMKWIGYDNCGRWLETGMTAHGESQNPEEKSSLEDAQAKVAQTSIGQKPQDAGGGKIRYANYVIDVKNPKAILDEKGKLDQDNIRNITLNDASTEASKQVGYKGGVRQMDLVMNESAEKGAKVILADDPLRDQVGRYTRMFYDNSLAKYNAGLASQKGVEAVINVSTSDCDKYFAEVRKGEAGPGEERLADQDVLDPLTEGNDLQTRQQLCKQLMSTSLNTYGAKVKGNQIEETGVNGDQAMVALQRAQAMVILNGGMDPNSIPLPEGTQLTADQKISERGQTQEGGLEVSQVKESNRDTLVGWNEKLKDAAVAAEEVAKMAGGKGAGRSKQILQDNLVNPDGGVNLVQFNSMTPIQREYVGTDYKPGETVFQQSTSDLQSSMLSTTTETTTTTELESIRLED